jgi:hypothetical protein
MFFSFIQKKVKISLILLVVGVLVFGFVCTGFFNKTSMDMSAMDTGMMSSEHEQSCCNLGAANHMNSLRDVALIAPDKTRDTLTLLALGLALLLGYGFAHIWNHRPPIDHDVGHLRLYIKSHPELVLFDHLKLAFARGILNPKIY